MPHIAFYLGSANMLVGIHRGLFVTVAIFPKVSTIVKCGLKRIAFQASTGERESRDGSGKSWKKETRTKPGRKLSTKDSLAQDFTQRLFV